MVERSNALVIFCIRSIGRGCGPGSKQRGGDDLFIFQGFRFDCGTGARIVCQEEANARREELRRWSSAGAAKEERNARMRCLRHEKRRSVDKEVRACNSIEW